MSILNALIAPVADLLDKIIPDPRARDAAKLELLKLQGSQDMDAVKVQLSAILAEAQSHSAKTLHKLKAKIAKLNVERDAVAQYLHNLREVVENAEQNLSRD